MQSGPWKNKWYHCEKSSGQNLRIRPATINCNCTICNVPNSSCVSVLGLLIKQGRWVETAELMQQGVQANPANRAFIELYARTLMQLNRDQQAITLLRTHAPAVATDPEYFALLAALYQRQQDHLAAANTYSQILKLRPDSGIWWVGLGISLEALGKQQQAQQAYARARQTGTLHGDLARYTDNRLLALDAIDYPVN